MKFVELKVDDCIFSSSTRFWLLNTRYIFSISVDPCNLHLGRLIDILKKKKSPISICLLLSKVRFPFWMSLLLYLHDCT